MQERSEVQRFDALRVQQQRDLPLAAFPLGPRIGRRQSYASEQRVSPRGVVLLDAALLQ